MPNHPITNMPLEDGHGALPVHVQAAQHCDLIEQSGNKERADQLRRELGIQTAEEAAEKQAEQEAADRAARDVIPRVDEAFNRLDDLAAAHDEHAGRLTEHHETIGLMLQRLDALETENADLRRAMDDLTKPQALSS